MKRLQFSKTGLGCGGSMAAIVTLLVSTGVLPEQFQQPDAIAMITGVLTTLASSFRICHIFERSASSGKPAKEE